MDSIYWLPWLHTYQKLQAATRTGASGVEADLKLVQQWLQEGAARFQPPSSGSAAALQKGGNLKAAAYGPGKGFAIDKQLVQATLELSKLLALDELQTHLLLKRVIKEKGLKPSTPAQQQQSEPPAAGTLLALPAPASSSSPAPATAAAGGPAQAVLSAEDVQAVADAYGQERAYLVKCQHLILKTALDVMCPASQACRSVLKQLLDQEWASKVFSNLEQLLSPEPQAARPDAAAGPVHAVKPPAFDQHRYLQRLNERCELMSLLTHLYVGADALKPHADSSSGQHAREMTLSPDIYAAQMLLQQISSRIDQDESDQAEAEALTGPLKELSALKWPSCSEQQFLSLLEKLGTAVYAASAGAVAATAPAGQLLLPYTGAAASAATGAAGGSGSNGSRSQALELQQLSEALGTSLVLAALRPAQLLMGMADLAHRTGPSVTSHFTRWRSIIPTLDQWRPVAGNAMALLAIHAYYQLLVAYSGIGGEEDITSSLQERAVAAGGFSAPAASLGLEELGVGTPAGWLHRGLLLQGLSLVALAGDPSPWRLPSAALDPLVKLLGDLVEGCPHLAVQMWDDSVTALQPLRSFVDDACGLFPAYLGPFLRLATGLIVGPEAAEACYEYLSKRPPLVVEFPGPGQPGLQVQPGGSSVYLEEDLPWPKAPEVIGTVFPGNIHGSIRPLPVFAQKEPTDSDMLEQQQQAAAGGSSVSWAPDVGPFLVAWDLQADQGMAQVLLLARAAHCLQRLHALDTARQPVAGTREWQDLHLILSLVSTLLRNNAQLADALLGVTIDYNSGQKVDWVDIIIAALNVLPGLAGRAATELHNKATFTQEFAATTTNSSGSTSSGSSAGAFAWSVLNSLADCLAATAAVAACQPSRVLSTLCSCNLFEGVTAAAEPLPLVALEDLGGWVQEQQAAGTAGSASDWSSLGTLQALQQMLEVPQGRYPLTRAVVNLTTLLLAQQSTWGPVPSLVGFTLHRVLGALPWLPFSDASDRWNLAAEALAAVRMALTAGAEGTRWCAGPKGLGPPTGVMVTVLAARVVHHLSTAGHGYLSAALPPPAPLLQAMADQVEGNSQLMQAAMTLAVEMLRLVPLLLGTCAHLSPEMPLQHYWGVEPPGGGMRPAAVITSYVLYSYSAELQLLARQALNTFAILQAPALQPSSRAGFRGGVPNPGSGGPAVPLGPSTAAGLGALQAGPVQPGLSPAQAVGHSGHHGVAATGLGVASQGGAGGWFRPGGLFAVLLTALPGLKGALVEPLHPKVAAHEPEMALSCLALLEAGIRFHPEILDALCFPSSLQQQEPPPPAGKKAHKAFSSLDGLLQLLKQAPELLASQPKLLAGVLRVLAVLWEWQTTAHGAVELLRGQRELWQGLKACLPVASRLPAFSLEQQLGEGEAAAWQLQVHAAALQIVLLEIHMEPPPPPAQAGGEASADTGRESLLSSIGPEEVMQLLIAASDLDLQLPLLPQLAVLLQITYLQAGASSVAGAWSSGALKSDAIRVGALFRSEVSRILQAAAAGQFTQRDLAAAPQLLANVAGQQAGAGPLQTPAAFQEGYAGEDGSSQMMTDAASSGGAADEGDGNVRVLMDWLLRQPLGEVLLSYAAVPNSSWGPGETEYGTSFLYSSDRILAALGTSLLSQSEALAPLCTSLDELSVSASVGHGRLLLLQAAARLFVGLWQRPGVRETMLQLDVSQELVSCCLQAVDRSLSEAVALSTSQAAPLLSAPWGLHFIAHASSSTLLTTSKVLLEAVYFWKAANARAGPAGLSSSSNSSSRRRSVLMARALNQQNSFGDAGQQQQRKEGARRSSGSGGSGSRSSSAVAATAKACAQTATSLSRWLRGPGGDSLSAAAAASAAAGAAAAVQEEQMKTVENLGTSLLLMLQLLPAQQLAAARGAASAAASGAGVSPAAAGRAALAAESPAELLELQMALLELLPTLCKAAAQAVSQQQGAAADSLGAPVAASGSSVADFQARESYVAVLLELLKENLRHQLQPDAWREPVLRHLDLVAMVQAAAARVNSLAGPGQAGALPAGSAADGGSSGGAAAAAAAGVTDISVLEVLQAVAEVPEGALQLWQQGILPVLVAFCRQLLHGPDQSGLLGAAALGYVGPDASILSSASGQGAAAGFPPQSGVMVNTMGAYAGLPGQGGGSTADSSSEDVRVVPAPRHQQWCMLLSVWASVLQQLSRTVHVQQAAMELLTAAEPRLQLAVGLLSSSYHTAISSSGRHGQARPDAEHDHASRALVLAMTGFTPDGLKPGMGRGSAIAPVLLTLSNLKEAEGSLFLLKFMVHSVGDWELQRPGSLASFRSAAASFIEFVATPSLERSFQVSCAPLSPWERRLAATPAGVTSAQGWFKACAAGGANSPQLVAAVAAAAVSGGSSGAAGALALVPAGGDPGSPLAAAASAGTAAAAAAAAAGCSEYCARLVEGMYAVCDHALALLVATAPAVDPAEVAGGQGLGPMWPSVRALAALLDQALAVGESVMGSDDKPHPARTPQAQRIGTVCCSIAAHARTLLGMLSPGGNWGASAGRRTAAAGGPPAEVEAQRRVERMASLQRATSSVPSF